MTITRDPRMNPQDPPPLDDDARALLLAYRQSREVPELVKARVGRKVQSDAPRRRNLWAAGLLAAAAAIVIAYGVGVGPGRGARSGPGMGEAASYSREGEAERAAKARGEVRARGPGVGTAGEAGEAAGASEATVASEASGESAVRAAGAAEASAATTSAAAGRAEGGRTGGSSARPRAAAGEAPVLDLAGERRLLEEAWRALTLGDEARAVAAARAHREAHPDGILAQERDAIEVIARCKAGVSAAADDAARFAERHPQSPWLPQIRAACPE